jgi:hypothetical protein
VSPVPPADGLHRRAQQALQQQVMAAVHGLITAITLDRTQTVRDAYAAAHSHLVAAGEYQAALLAVTYVGAYAPPRLTPDLPTALAGTLMTPDHPGAIVGLLRLWTLLDQGTPEPQARTEAGSFTANLTGGDMQAAQRVGLDEGARIAERRLRWRKDPAPGACDWCRMIASGGARYHSASSVPFHQSDRCAVVPQPT